MIIVWHHKDLRVEDHPALSYAAHTGLPVLPLYLFDPEAEGKWAPGQASLWWLHHSLLSLEQSYKKLGSKLVIAKGDTEKVLQKLIRETKASEITWIERVEPKLIDRDRSLKKTLESRGLKVSTFIGNYLIDPSKIKTTTGKPYTVYTPFSKAAFDKAPFDTPSAAPSLSKTHLPASLPVKDLDLLPEVAWDQGLKNTWTPGREGAMKALRRFAQKACASYAKDRDFLAMEGTSRLSPHLCFGEISPKEIWKALASLTYARPYLRQILWREFAHNFLHHFPKTTDLSWREAFEKFPWSSSQKDLKLWQKGQTGYPIVDAAMRQLWDTGWMHNRARMIVGSFLIKDLHIHWKLGAKWFWDTLVDADLPNNTLGWQWVAGSGPDAAPYFRIFNPILQSKKFDPEGLYIKTYVPELAKLPKEHIHTPWLAPEEILQKAGVVLGETYPFPMVDHDEVRKEALEAYNKIKG